MDQPPVRLFERGARTRTVVLRAVLFGVPVLLLALALRYAMIAQRSMSAEKAVTPQRHEATSDDVRDLVRQCDTGACPVDLLWVASSTNQQVVQWQRDDSLWQVTLPDAPGRSWVEKLAEHVQVKSGSWEVPSGKSATGTLLVYGTGIIVALLTVALWWWVMIPHGRPTSRPTRPIERHVRLWDLWTKNRHEGPLYSGRSGHSDLGALQKAVEQSCTELTAVAVALLILGFGVGALWFSPLVIGMLLPGVAFALGMEQGIWYEHADDCGSALLRGRLAGYMLVGDLHRELGAEAAEVIEKHATKVGLSAGEIELCAKMATQFSGTVAEMVTCAREVGVAVAV